MKRKIENQKVKIAAAKAALESMSAAERAKAEVKIGTMEKQLTAMETAMSEIEAEKAKKKEERLQEKANEAERKRDEAVNSVGGGEWEDRLMFDDNGRLKPCLHNVTTIIGNSEEWGAKLRKNTLTSMYELGTEPMTDEKLTRMYVNFYDKTGIDSKRWVQEAMVYTASQNSYHPVLEAVEKLEWNPDTDKDVLHDFFIKTVGAEDTKANREMSFRWLCAMYRRVKHPGCYFDSYLILSDPTQGTGKTTIFERLTGGLGIKRGDGSSVVLTAVNVKPDTGDKDKMMVANESVIVQFDESDEMKYSKLEKFKSFITTRQIKMRMPYDRYPKDFNIHCVYAVTTNDEKFLTDSSTDFERRVWAMRCHGTPGRSHEEWKKLLPDELIQKVWAEAKYWDEHLDECYERYGYKMREGDIHLLTDEAKKELFEVQMSAKTMEDDVEAINAIHTIFTSKYTKKTFDIPEDFYSEARGSAYFRSEGRVNELEEIPVKWLAGAVNRLANGSKNKSMPYIERLMGSKSVTEVIGVWTKKLTRYNGNQMMCYVKKPKEADGKKPSEPVLKPVTKQNKPKPGEFGSDGLFDDFEVDF